MVFKIREGARLYHGSPKELKVLKPHYSRIVGMEVVYASQFKGVALCFAGKQWTDLDLDLGEINGVIHLKELKPDAFDAFDCSGYLYRFNAEGFETHDNLASFEVIGFKPITDIRQESIENIFRELRDTDIKLIYHPRSKRQH